MQEGKILVLKLIKTKIYDREKFHKTLRREFS